MDYHLFITRVNEIWARVQSYPPREVLIELGLLWIVVYVMHRFLRGTRGGRVFKGLAMILIVATPIIKIITSQAQFDRLNFLYNYFITFAVLTLVIVFQPELRRALVRLGEASLFRGGGVRSLRVVEEIVASATYLSRHRVGALIAIERQVGLDGIVEAGTPLDATITRELLNTIFWPNTALHDMAVIIREDRIASAGTQLPLTESTHIAPELGSRHRAAIGLSEESDAVVIIVSEQTGAISVAHRGTLTRELLPDDLQYQLRKLLGLKLPKTKPGKDAPAATPDAPPAQPVRN